MKERSLFQHYFGAQIKGILKIGIRELYKDFDKKEYE